MDTYLWILFLATATLSILPLSRLDVFSVSKRYFYFKYLSIFLFIWTIVTDLKYLSDIPFLTYYISLTVFPLIFILTALLFMSIRRYLGKKIPKLAVIFFLIFLLLELFATYSNNFFLMMIDIPYSSDITFDMIRGANFGWFFMIHTGVCYSIIAYSFVMISKRLYINLKKDNDVFPFVVIVLSIIVGIVLNIMHIFFIEFMIDPTYIAFVLLVSLLYTIFYIRDIKMILRIKGNDLILDNLREMYLLVNQRGEVVSASSELVEKFDICVDNKISFEDFKIMVSNKAVIYKDPSELDSEYIEDKIYLHMMEKKINLPMLKRKGTFYLFYDETKNQKYINELNFVLTHDLMTKIYNRNYFETLEKEIEEDYNKYSLVMFDLDGLKIFNDYLGHEAGDKLLKNFADALTQVTNKFKDLIPIRMGGDEFLLIGLNKDMNDIEEILYELKIITSNNDLRKHIGFSYGYSQNNFENKSFKLMLLEADANLYKMKPNRKKDKDKLEKFFQSLSS